MSLASDIRKLGPPIPSNLHPNERAPVEEAPAPAERKQGRSMFGSDGGREGSFEHYYGTGSDRDKEAGRSGDRSGRNGSRLGVGDAFKEAADGYKPHITVKAHSRFGEVGKQMLEAHPARVDDSGAYAKAKDLYLHSEDGGKAFETYISSLSEEQRQYISDRLDEEGENEE